MFSKSSNALIIFASIIAGLFNGLLGAGGGILLVFATEYIYPTIFQDKKDVYLNVQFAMIFISIISCFIYAKIGDLNYKDFTIFALPAIVGGIVGALLLPKFKSDIIKGIFSILVIWSGFKMLFF